MNIQDKNTDKINQKQMFMQIINQHIQENQAGDPTQIVDQSSKSILVTAGHVTARAVRHFQELLVEAFQ